MRILTALLLVLVATTCFADQQAITDTGEKVILFTDGTWSYADSSQLQQQEIATNPQNFKTPSGSTFMLKSTKNRTACWLNTTLWSFEKSTSNEAAEYEFELKGEDLYGMAINEGLSMPISTLSKIALDNAKAAAPNTRIIKKEYRTVNGLKVLYMEMTGTMDGIDFTYLGYYYSDKSGSTQLVTYTGANLVEKYRSRINDFLNGFSLQ